MKYEIYRCINPPTNREKKPVILQYITLNIKIKEQKIENFEKFSKCFWPAKIFFKKISIFFRFRKNGAIFKNFEIFEKYSQNFFRKITPEYIPHMITYQNSVKSMFLEALRSFKFSPESSINFANCSATTRICMK